MTPEMVTRLCIQWWGCEPTARRTRERLASIVAHYADVYAIPRDQWPGMVSEAWTLIPAWQKARTA